MSQKKHQKYFLLLPVSHHSSAESFLKLSQEKKKNLKNVIHRGRIKREEKKRWHTSLWSAVSFTAMWCLPSDVRTFQLHGSQFFSGLYWNSCTRSLLQISSDCVEACVVKRNNDYKFSLEKKEKSERKLQLTRKYWLFYFSLHFNQKIDGYFAAPSF